MSTVIKMECDDCSKGKYVEEETISHIREKVDLFKALHMGWKNMCSKQGEFIFKFTLIEKKSCASIFLSDRFLACVSPVSLHDVYSGVKNC